MTSALQLALVPPNNGASARHEADLPVLSARPTLRLTITLPAAGHPPRLMAGSVAVVGLLIGAAFVVLVFAVNAGRLSLGLQEARNDEWESSRAEFPGEIRSPAPAALPGSRP